MYRKKLIRLRDYDYRAAGYYFTTICTDGRKLILGECSGDNVLLSPVGEIVRECWQLIPQFHSHIDLDEFVVMPNHVHGILYFHEVTRSDDFSKRCSVNSLRGSLASVLCSFKTASTKEIRRSSHLRGEVWQRGYYEHIIRDEKSLQSIRTYIQNNPILWHLDELNEGRTNSAPLR
jgi:REP element-mobilizing transposase RayT